MTAGRLTGLARRLDQRWPRHRFGLQSLAFAHRLAPQLSEECSVAPGEALAYVGFYRSDYALALAAKLDPSSRLVLVEADPQNYERLVAGLAGHPAGNRIHAINLALWKGPGTVPFEIYRDPGRAEFNRISITTGAADYGGASAVIDVPCDSFDHVFERFPDVRHVYVAINGAELEALEGMQGYLRTPGASVWIKSPFRNRATQRRMSEEVAEVLGGHGMKVVTARKPRPDPNPDMGKVFAYQPL